MKVHTPVIVCQTGIWTNTPYGILSAQMDVQSSQVIRDIRDMLDAGHQLPFQATLVTETDTPRFGKKYLKHSLRYLGPALVPPPTPPEYYGIGMWNQGDF